MLSSENRNFFLSSGTGDRALFMDLTESGEKMNLILSKPFWFVQCHLLLPGSDTDRNLMDISNIEIARFSHGKQRLKISA
jgi:hypothetical protein